MPKLFDEDSDEELSLQTNKEYAKTYNNWRKKEELNKLKTKYGDDIDSSSDSSSEDEEDPEISNEFEMEFLKTLSCLKNKDPCIYDGSKYFFENHKYLVHTSKKSKEKPLYLKDYERKLIVENAGQLSDENEQPKPKTLTYTEEQEQLKNELKGALENISKEGRDDWGGLFKERQKTEEEKLKEDQDYKLWLAGQKQSLKDTSIENQLKPLKDFWNNPNLDENEKFLRDYILKNRFRDGDDENYIPTYQEVVHDSDNGLSEDESEINKQEEFEHKYNFRFEEPDQEFIKRYPRTMENSLRKKDDRRKVKRLEVKERKNKEKLQKMEEIKQLKAMKKKEIEEKIQMLKEITGNNDVGFNMDDVDGDFDPEEHDKRMQSLFNDEFYGGQEGEQKPVFPDIDRELGLEIENWDRWQGEKDEEVYNEEENFEPYCEDDDFNMDCDYDPTEKNQRDLIEATKSKKKRKRKSKFAKAVSRSKPIFNPEDKSFSEYLDEYYNLDCEDIIGDLPCRFKYREVVPNNFGLTTEEILLANDKELNRWCSLKKAVQIRPENVEKYDKIIYERKAKDGNLKRKILPSLYTTTDEKSIENNLKEKLKSANDEISEKEIDTEKNVIKRSKKQKRDKPKVPENNEAIDSETPPEDKNAGEKVKKSKKTNNKAKKWKVEKIENIQKKNANNKRKRKSTELKSQKNKKNEEYSTNYTEITDSRLAAYGINPKKFKNKIRYGKVKNN